MEKTIANQVGFSQVFGRGAEVLRRLEEAGLTYDDLQVPIDDLEMRKRLVRFWRSGGYESTTTQKLAREIMGKNFFSVEEAVQYFGVKPTRAQLSALSEIPFTEAELREVKDTHVLVAVFPLSILEIRDKVERNLFYSYEGAWYNKEAFAKDRGDARWQLVRKTPVENSTNKTWQEQQTLLSNKEETPKAQVMVYTIIGHFLATGERLFERTYVRCSDLDSDGYRVYVGHFDSDGLHVFYYWDGHRYYYLGLSSARKS